MAADPWPTLVLKEREERNPDNCPLLRDAWLPLSRRSTLPHLVGNLLRVVEYRDGLGLIAGDAVGCATIPLLRSGRPRRQVVRVTVEPAHPSVTLRDVVAMMLYTETGRWLPHTIDAAPGEDFIEILCRAYAIECRRLVRRGPSRTYVRARIEARRPVGRLDVRHYAISWARGVDRLRYQRFLHSSENDYNRLVAAGLGRAARLASDPVLRRQCRLLGQTLAEELPFPRVPSRPLFYGGQFAHYRPLHDLALLLIQGSGGDPGRTGEAGFIAFSVRPDVLFQDFLYRLTKHVLRGTHEVALRRHPIFEDEAGRLLVQQGYVVPDIEVLGRGTNVLELILDAKYEKLEHLAAGDFYQAYVYADLLGHSAQRQPLPVLLVSPAETLNVNGARRGARSIDSRVERPIIWTVGVRVSDLISSDSGIRETARSRLAAVLRQFISNPTTHAGAA